MICWWGRTDLSNVPVERLSGRPCGRHKEERSSAPRAVVFPFANRSLLRMMQLLAFPIVVRFDGSGIPFIQNSMPIARLAVIWNLSVKAVGLLRTVVRFE